MTRAEWNKRPGRSSSFVRKSLRFAVYARDKFDCVYCRDVFPIDLTGAGLHLDHVVPRSQGGKDTPDNLVTACERCNTRKGARRGTFDRKQQARARRATKRLINRELGLWLCKLAASTERLNNKRAPFPEIGW